MNCIHITTRKKLKEAKPSAVRKTGFLKLGRVYEYSFNSPQLYREVLCKNPGVQIDGLKTVTAGIISGGAV